MTLLKPQRLGHYYENFALNYLQQAGLVYIARNIRYACGELDLIMRDNTKLVFIEVRFRRSDKFGGAALSITRKKQERLLQAANCWLMSYDQTIETCECRFDIFAITGQHVEWFQNAFNDE